MTPARETWLVTGTSRGIGLAVTEAHLARGGAVIATYRGASPESLAVLQSRFGARVIPVCHDLRTPLLPSLISRPTPRVDVLFHNGGVYGPRTSSFRGQNYAALLDTLDINALGLIRVTEAVVPLMAGAPRPRIAAVSSLMGTRAKAGSDSLAYRVSKAAMNMAFHVIAADLAEDKIAMACLRPGHVRTNMGGPNGAISPEESAQAMLQVVDQLEFSMPPPFLDLTGETLDW